MLVYWCSPIRVHWMSPHSHWLCIITFGPLQSIWLRFQLPIRSLRCVFPLLYTSELSSGVRLSNTNQQARLWYWYPLLFSLRCWSTTWPQYILLVSTLGCLLLPWPELNLFLYLHILSEGQFVYKWHSAVVYQRFYFGGLDLDSLFCHLFCPPQFPLSCIFPRSLFYPLVIQAILVCFSSLCSFLFNITKQETKNKNQQTNTLLNRCIIEVQIIIKIFIVNILCHCPDLQDIVFSDRRNAHIILIHAHLTITHIYIRIPWDITHPAGVSAMNKQEFWRSIDSLFLCLFPSNLMDIHKIELHTLDKSQTMTRRSSPEDMQM